MWLLFYSLFVLDLIWILGCPDLVLWGVFGGHQCCFCAAMTFFSFFFHNSKNVPLPIGTLFCSLFVFLWISNLFGACVCFGLVVGGVFYYYYIFLMKSISYIFSEVFSLTFLPFFSWHCIRSQDFYLFTLADMNWSLDCTVFLPLFWVRRDKVSCFCH